jgi:hypothetical protein
MIINDVYDRILKGVATCYFKYFHIIHLNKLGKTIPELKISGKFVGTHIGYLLNTVSEYYCYIKVLSNLNYMT